MLNTIESFLAKVINPVLPTGTLLITGLMPPPAASDAPVVNVFVNALKFTESMEEAKRQPAYSLKRISLTGDGNLLDFTLPNDAKGDVIEVELSPGRLAKTGDDYWLEGRKLKFYTPPLTSFSVLLRGERATGYQASSSCLGFVSIDVWAAQNTIIDDYLTPALIATLSAFVELDCIELSKTNTSGFFLRLSKPLLELETLECTQSADLPLICHRARLRLSAECELMLALETLVTENLILQIDDTLKIITQKIQ